MENLPKTASGKPDFVLAQDLKIWEETIQSIRQNLDKINIEILSLLNKRANIVKKILQLKGHTSGQSSIEQYEESLWRILGYNAGPLHDQSIEEIFRMIISKDIFL